MRTCPFTLLLLLATTSVASANTVVPEPAPEAALQQQEDSHWGGGGTIRGDEHPNYVTFTFDDGPDPDTTPAVLEALQAHNVPAAFFVVGRRFVGASPASQEGATLLQSMAAMGFLIGNHTTNHHSLAQQPFASAAKSIVANAKDLARVLGYEPRLFRPPFGATTAKIRKLLRTRGDTLVRWNIDPQDFHRDKRKDLREEVVRTILARNGGVVLLHDTKVATARALKGILEDLEQANCQRLAEGQSPILPVSLHYFMRNPDGSARPIPPEVLKTTQINLTSLRKACKIGD